MPEKCAYNANSCTTFIMRVNCGFDCFEDILTFYSLTNQSTAKENNC